MRVILKWLASAAATALAVWLVPGITLTAADRQGQVLTLLGVAAILGIVNAIVKPIAQVVGFCLVILTLGLFLQVINAAMLSLTSWLSGQLGLGFHVDGFLPALIGSIIISIATALVSSVLGLDEERN